MNRRASKLQRILMLGTFGMQPKGTMSARAAGIAATLRERGIDTRIATVPWDNPASAGTSDTWMGVPVTNTRTVNPLFWPLAVRELLQVAGEFQPDLIHLFKPKGFGDLAARYLQRRGVPVVVDMDDWEGTGGWNDVLPYSRLQRNLFDWQERTWPRMANGLTVASRTLYQLAVGHGASEYRVLYLPNQLTAERLADLSTCSSHREQDREHASVLLYTRFVEFDPAFPVQVLANLQRGVPGCRLVVAGRSQDGHAEQRMLRHARQNGLESSIEMRGWVTPTDLGALTASCDAALVPFDDTMLNRAKCSVKLLELLATGIPVVASNVGENREYLQRHGGGVLARPGDPLDHASRLQEILTNPHVVCAADFSHSGSWHAVTDELLTHFSAAV